MVRTVYSTAVTHGWIHDAASGAAFGYTVPAGKVLVIRNIDWYVSTAGLTILGRTSGGYWFASTNGTVSGYVGSWRGDQVLNAGERFGASWITGEFLVTVSGFLLLA